jgi:dihydrofolate reductase
MARLIYSMIASLDGYVTDEHGDFSWAVPDAEAHAFVNDLERPVGTYLYGRRMYETMVAWETGFDTPDQPRFISDFAAIWRAADKIVYSRTLEAPSSARTRIERGFVPDEVRRIKAAAESAVTIGGPDLAGQAIRTGLVDELRVFVAPVVTGGGTRLLPENAPLGLDLLDERRFRSGMVYLRYRIGTETAQIVA